MLGAGHTLGMQVGVESKEGVETAVLPCNFRLGKNSGGYGAPVDSGATPSSTVRFEIEI